ncbi:MAG TPA: hypothetical protein VH857_02890 [Actinomycetes bacterium]|nr:hypothetical protein [Actinomycetes bacterium]
MIFLIFHPLDGRIDPAAHLEALRCRKRRICDADNRDLADDTAAARPGEHVGVSSIPRAD